MVKLLPSPQLLPFLLPLVADCVRCQPWWRHSLQHLSWQKGSTKVIGDKCWIRMNKKETRTRGNNKAKINFVYGDDCEKNHQIQINTTVNNEVFSDKKRAFFHMDKLRKKTDLILPLMFLKTFVFIYFPCFLLSPSFSFLFLRRLSNRQFNFATFFSWKE